MRALKIFAVFSAASALLLTSAPAAQKKHKSRAPSGVRSEYYYGQVLYSSADGKIEYGKTSSLVKRVIDPASGRITETVLQPAGEPGGKPDEFVTVLKRAGPTSVFNAADKGGTFTGIVTFVGGSTWAWTRWLYDIKLSAGGAIRGGGELVPGGLRTEKRFTKADGGVTRIIEDLKTISRRQYGEQRTKMRAIKAAK